MLQLLYQRSWSYQALTALKNSLLVERVGLDAADVVGFHGMQSIHELLQLPLEAAAHTAELVALPHFAAPALA